MSILLGCIVQRNLFTLRVHILMLNLGNWEFFLWSLIKIQNFVLYSTSFKYLGTTWTSIPKTKREGKVQIKRGVSLSQLGRHDKIFRNFCLDMFSVQRKYGNTELKRKWWTPIRWSAYIYIHIYTYIYIKLRRPAGQNCRKR